MQKKTLEAHEFPLKEVFCDDYSFEIPGYQRPYSWEKEQAETLVSDLLGFFRGTTKRHQRGESLFPW